MTWEILALALFLGAAGGVIVPVVALIKHQQLALRIARQPAATALENVESLLHERRSELEELRGQLSDLAAQLARRDMAVAEAEEARIKLAGLEESLALMESKRLEIEQLDQSLASRQEAMADLVQRSAETAAKLEEQERALRRVTNELVITEEQAKSAEERRSLLEQAVESLRQQQREMESTLQEQTLLLRRTEGALADRRAKITEADEALVAITKEVDERRAIRDAFNAEIAEHERALRSVRNDLAVAEELARKAEERRSQLEQAVDALGLQQRTLDAVLQQKSLELQGTEGALADKRTKIAEAEDVLRQQRKDLDDMRATRDTLNAEVIMLEQRKAELERTKATLQGYIEQARTEHAAEEENALADLKRVPPCLGAAGLDADRGWLEEERALDGLQSYLSDLGMRFPVRILNAFHTSLKINSLSPLTVLAGISGTGKSELPRRYAEGMGMHFFQMAVQPRWDSPQDLFGFYNYLEHRYIGTDLARALIHLDDHNHPDLAGPWRDRMLLVLLDEMNLARVEYYFSEFLSRLEVRKSVMPDNAASRQNAEVHLDVGGRDRTFSLYVDRNVLFVGTMNEDESTQTLSDKVIDRANVLRFGRPKTMADEHPRHDVTRSNRYLSRQVWAKWERSPDALDHQSREKLRSWITQLNDAMEALERPFGHRVNQAIQLYCANYPATTQHSLAHAFSDQLEQRILPKLRGIDTLEFSTPLGQIEDLIASIGDDPLAEAVHNGRQRPLFGWQGLNRDN